MYISNQFVQSTGINIQMGEEKRIKIHAFISLLCCTKVGTKVIPPSFFFFKFYFIFIFFYSCDARYSFLLYTLESNTVLLKQDHQCSSQSRAFIAVAVQNGRCGQIF